MAEDGFFNILDSVDSTNNYAMGTVHAGTATHGTVWFSSHQTAGKGQRGKTWSSEPGKNIAMSLVLNPQNLSFSDKFHLSAVVALSCFKFVKALAGAETTIKWPNDIYWRDRKAGGILIENNFSGHTWKWAVVGIGININQTIFEALPVTPVSVKEITGREFDVVALAKQLHGLLMQELISAGNRDIITLMQQYNEHLYKRSKAVTLKKEGARFETVIKEVTPQGRLVTVDAIEREFEFGEVEWVL